ncbi:MAG: maltose acetyltransferase domain-containing protein [Nitrospira sp.]|nr:maltose acetyltransferase domain-containing protein [Nitrospira sp.]
MATQSEKDKVLAGELYRSADEELVANRRRVKTILARYNAICDGDPILHNALLREFLGAVARQIVGSELDLCTAIVSNNGSDALNKMKPHQLLLRYRGNQGGARYLLAKSCDQCAGAERSTRICRG